ncbi:hypothetical protein SAMN04487906_2778 [Zhouia amylolytica]|uniref:Riboflavin synthase subunit beta n=2 Tax=Zhouia amylolytica TaxID=376730 RepID=W2UU54_9FLAO|nr:hypothetical protein [Zhouia amylolytica]ETN97061.1 hypothetical protein P278_04870 [Zhouia amylolytica AD3]MCQ0110099.1 hypothetical protein [Zhouia amylolytica]SFT07314.1 hypothetical protein SAMN04487906_2778 [Zhouia amylolytica]
MRLPTLFKQQGNKSYSYTPRYYDERKERLEKLKEKHSKKSDREYFEGYRRKSFREDWKANRRVKSNNNSRVRFVVILILLLMFAYVALKNINLDTLF